MINPMGELEKKFKQPEPCYRSSLYDEDRWPSGFAGGLATGKKKHPMRLLRIGRPVSDQGCKSARWTFKILTLPPHWWYNNCGYLDTLNQKAVGEFIKSTHVVYKKTVGKEFNKTIPAIFTDEPNYLSTLWTLPWGKDFYLPWTDGLDKLFLKQYNYDLRSYFLSLIESRGDYQKVRYHFARLVSELFTENFASQIYDWCEENNIAFTGHYLMEDTLLGERDKKVFLIENGDLKQAKLSSIINLKQWIQNLSAWHITQRIMHMKMVSLFWLLLNQM